MAELERTYNVPLRKGIMKVPEYKRANKAIRVLRKFLERHMKSEDVKIGPYLNSKILEHGRKNIPHHVEVKAIKEDGIVKAELLNAKSLDFLKPKAEKKEDEVKLKIPGFGKKKIEEVVKEEVKAEEKHKEISEKEKKEILEHPPEKKIETITKIEHKDKEAEIKIKEDQVYGRLGSKKTKVKEGKK